MSDERALPDPPGGSAAPLGSEAPAASEDMARRVRVGRTDGGVPGAPGALLVIISGPSGVGKDTVIAALRARSRDPDYHYVVTCTTRARRPGEVDGVHYRFLSRDRFLAMVDAGELLEANEVHGNWYGTPRADVRDALVAGRDVILKIDVQGAQVVKENVPDALLVFLVPPSLQDLFVRLRSRATETADELDLRQRNAAIELARQEDYDHVVTNETGEVARTAALIDEIIANEHRLHPTRRVRV